MILGKAKNLNCITIFFSFFVFSNRKGYLSALLKGGVFSLSQGIIYFAYSASFRLGGHLVGKGSLTFDSVFL